MAANVAAPGQAVRINCDKIFNAAAASFLVTTVFTLGNGSILNAAENGIIAFGTQAMAEISSQIYDQLIGATFQNRPTINKLAKSVLVLVPSVVTNRYLVEVFSRQKKDLIEIAIPFLAMGLVSAVRNN